VFPVLPDHQCGCRWDGRIFPWLSCQLSAPKAVGWHF